MIINTLTNSILSVKIKEDNDISLCYWEFTDGFAHDVDSRVLYMGSEGYDYDLLNVICTTAAKEVIGTSNEFFTNKSKDDYLLSATLYSNISSPEGFTLYEYDDDNFGLVFDNDDWVYSLPKIHITYLDIDKFILCDPNLALISINTVNNLDIDLPNVTTSIKVSPYIRKNEDGTNMIDAYGNEVVAVDIDMTEMDNLPLSDTSKQEQMTWFYQDIVTIKIDGIYDEDIADSAELNEIGYMHYNFNSDYMSEYDILSMNII